MPILDTPITTDDNGLHKILAQNLPVALYLYDSRQPGNGPVDDAIAKLAKKHAGELLIARLDVAASPRAYRDYGSPATPALVTLVKGLMGRKVKSQAANVRPADVRAHIDYLLDRGPQPAAEPAAKPEQPQPAAGVQHVTDANFKQVVLNSKLPVIVDFWAPWCGPCRMIAPVLDQAAKDYAGRVRVVKLNVDDNPRTAQQFQVQSIPTLIAFKDGRPLRRQVGANARAIRDLIEEALA